MTARELFDRIATQLRSVTLPRITADDVEAFLARYDKRLIAAIQHQYDERCRLGRLVPSFEDKVGQVDLTELDLGPTTATWAEQFTADTVKLAVKSRCHPANPDIREYAVHLFSDKLNRWLAFPGETWVWAAAEALQRFVENNFTRLRWRNSDVDGGWDGARGAPIELESPFAIGLAKTWDVATSLTDEDRTELDRARQERWERHYRDWTAGQRSGKPGTFTTPTVSLSSSEPAAPPTTTTAALSSEPTPWGGQRGAELPSDTVREGMRVVTAEGLHGTVVKVSEWTSVIVGSRSRRETHLTFDLRLDSGRVESGVRHVFTEMARPTLLVPDVSLDEGKTYLPPIQAWREVKRDYDAIRYYTEKGDNARKPANKREYARLLKQSQDGFLRRFAAFHAWRTKHPEAPIGDPVPEWRGHDSVAVSAEFTALAYRIMELESGVDAPRWPGELKGLKALPKDYATRLKPGDPIRAHTTDGGGNWGQEDAVLKGIAGEDAILDDDSRTPLYYVRLAPDAPVELPTYTEPKYLVDLGTAMLSDSGSRYPNRGAIARAVKEFLALHRIDVRTHVATGSMVTGIDLRPGGGRWTAAEVERMNTLLGNLGARSDGASFEPWQREGREYSPYDDYAPKGSGLVITPEHIPTFAPLLAAAMKDADQNLNRIGEGWVARLRGPRTVTGSTSSGSARGSATTDQRQSAAEGCREDEFDLPGYGRIRVVCGQKGRRDSWHNVWIDHRRYGTNGGRWARGDVPPVAVLQAIRERGITAFETQVERLEELSGGADDGLDPVIRWTLEQGGIRPNQLALLNEDARFRTRLIPDMVRPDGLTFRALGERWQEREEEGLRGFDPESIFVELYEFMLAESRIAWPPGLNPDDIDVSLEGIERLTGATGTRRQPQRTTGAKRPRLERLAQPRESDLQLDPVIALAVRNGGLRANLIRDIAPDLRGKARAIPGFLRPDGKNWLELAQAHYGPDVPVVEGSPSLEEWDRTGAEGTDGYVELTHWGGSNTPFPPWM